MSALQLLQIIEARGGVATLKPDERGGFKINVDPRPLALELLPELKRLKPALIELMRAASLVQQPPQPSPFWRLSEFVYVPGILPPPEVQQQRHREALAREILAASYFNEIEGVWCICWDKGRHAWQRYTIDAGGSLDERTGVPSIDAPTCIDWARQQLATIVTIEPSNDEAPHDAGQASLFELEAAA